MSVVLERTAAQWDQEYREGSWERLRGYVAHYAVVGALVWKYGPGSVLDVGCGEGVLRKFLYGSPRYFGIDISAEALTKAIGYEFGVFDAETFVPGRLVDSVIFCESLYYMREPGELLSKYLKSAKFAVVSIFDSDKTAGLVSGLLSTFKVADDVHITSGDSGWRVMVLKV